LNGFDLNGFDLVEVVVTSLRHGRYSVNYPRSPQDDQA
jgi:hypothetical protein